MKHKNVRGGSWYSSTDHLRCARRGSNVPFSHDLYLGFRVIRSKRKITNCVLQRFKDLQEGTLELLKEIENKLEGAKE